MNNWIEDLEKFLKIDEKLPEYQTPTGRVKKRKSIIGQLCAKHNSISNIIDVAMIPSLGKNDEINPLVKNYGMIIMDECHHGASSTAMGVLREVNAKYVYGLTATPKRDDGQEQKIFMYLGPIRYRYTAKDRARQQQIAHYIIPRFTRLIDVNAKSMKINDAYKAVRTSEIRNQQIINDVTMCLKNGRTPLVLTKFKDHAAYLYEHLKNAADHVFLLQGGVSTKRQDLLRKEMKLVPAEKSIILVAIGQYIGEGFNYPRLDTMMLTIPIAWQGNVEQYAGRLHRDYDGKNEVVIYDYVDSHIRVLEKMYHKRLRAYKKMGYDLRSTDKILQPYQKTNAIFDKTSYMEIYENDVLSAQQEIIISSPRISTRKILKIIQLLKGVQERGVKITIATLQSCEWPSSQREKVDCQIRTLINSGIDVKLFSHMHEHYAIFDKHIVWYGSMNLLSNEKEDDSMMRLDSKEIAQELMKVTFGTTSK